MDREEKREALKQDALTAWRVYQENGKHLTMGEADAWLASLEAGEDHSFDAVDIGGGEYGSRDSSRPNRKESLVHGRQERLDTSAKLELRDNESLKDSEENAKGP